MAAETVYFSGNISSGTIFTFAVDGSGDPVLNGSGDSDSGLDTSYADVPADTVITGSFTFEADNDGDATYGEYYDSSNPASVPLSFTLYHPTLGPLVYSFPTHQRTIFTQYFETPEGLNFNQIQALINDETHPFPSASVIDGRSLVAGSLSSSEMADLTKFLSPSVDSAIAIQGYDPTRRQHLSLVGRVDCMSVYPTVSTGGCFNADIEVTPIPGTIILTNITLPKRVTMTQVPTVAGCLAPESNYEPIQLNFDGKISTDTPKEFRTLVDEMLEWLAGEVTLEIWPDRFCNARVQQHTLDPQWPGVNDTFVLFKFDAIVPDGYFFDVLGNIFRTP